MARDEKSSYYDAGGIETLNVIEAKLTPEEYRGYLKGNAIKYLCRAAFKGNEARDAEKAANYALWYSQQLDGSFEVAGGRVTITNCTLHDAAQQPGRVEVTTMDEAAEGRRSFINVDPYVCRHCGAEPHQKHGPACPVPVDLAEELT